MEVAKALGGSFKLVTLRYKTETRPGLVALYDIEPGNGVGQFLQPRSPHGAIIGGDHLTGALQVLYSSSCHHHFDHP